MSCLKGVQLTDLQIAEIVLEQLPADWNAISCVAIALAESGGWTKAVNVVDHDPDARAFNSLDLGLWQTNTYWHPAVQSQQAFDPHSQMRYVAEISKKPNAWSRNWSLWTTYKTGAHRPFLGRARHAINAAAGTRL